MSLQSNSFPETLEETEEMGGLDAREQFEQSALQSLRAAVADLADLGYSFFGDISPIAASAWAKRIASDSTPTAPIGEDPIPL